ncbi:MAG: DUF4214 domain-containing protein [Clostridiales bacterium]|nr:DUF4214 domain-containing protein [Clostridiales bacterium]
MYRTHTASSFVSKIAACLTAILVAGSLLGSHINVRAATTTVALTGSYGQTEARDMLTLINQFRTGSDAWYWNSSNTNRITVSGLQPLTYDYDLEQIAMMRAIEAAISFDHTRLDGSRCFTASYNGIHSSGENIAGNFSADKETAFEQWKEDAEQYDGQGHRRNMLNSNFTAVGIGHVYYNGRHYWVQEFGMTPSNASYTAPTDGNRTYTVPIDYSRFQLSATMDTWRVSGPVGQSASYPSLMIGMTTSETWGQGLPVDTSACTVRWSSSDDSVFSVASDGLRFTGAGEAALTANVTYNGLSANASVPVNVTRLSITDSSIRVTFPETVYNGSAQTPVPTVTCNGIRLREGVDYELDGYYNNTYSGENAYVYISGIGSYTGRSYFYFTIASRDISECTVTNDLTATYSLAGDVVPDFSISYGDYELNEYYDYDIECSNNGSVGTGTITFTGTGDFIGRTSRNFTILPGNISDLSVSLPVSSVIYNGQPATPDVRVRDGGQYLVRDVDFTVTYINNSAPGVGTATVTGIGNFTGSSSVMFNILAGSGSSSEGSSSQEVILPSVPASGFSVSDFVERLYTVALDRASDPVGRQNWVDAATQRGETGADLARGFLYSDEFLGKGMSNEEFVRVLYRTFFNREADPSGLNGWVSELDNGASKQSVIEGFINSTEWTNLCLLYGIRSGGTGAPSISVEPNQDTVDFATRLYTTCLGRNADLNGLMAWARQLSNQRETGTGAARGFFFSNEFIDQNVSDTEYVNRLYRTFMGREADQAGFDAWVAQLNAGVSREEVFNGFAASPEFAQICASYGIIR